jgi:3',5'-cyclic AMP phosphodiesterase CpdA
MKKHFFSPSGILTSVLVVFLAAAALIVTRSFFRPEKADGPFDPSAYPEKNSSDPSDCRAPGTVCAGIITDIGACGKDAGNYAFREPLLRQFVETAARSGTDFNISLGDNANYGLRQCSESGRQDLQWVKERLSGPSFHYALGDHDVESEDDWNGFWRDLTGRDTNYFSFDRDGVHIVVLDTVLGGDPLRARCEEDPACSEYERKLSLYKGASGNPSAGSRPAEENGPKTERRSEEKEKYAELLSEEQAAIKKTRSAAARDKGRVGEKQLEWLENDLRSTPLERVVVFSDHPLFAFQSHRKAYDIINREAVQKILRQSGKRTVAISGEAHLWHEEEIDGIRYFIVDEFAREGSWALFRWGRDGFMFTKMLGDGEDRRERTNEAR